MGILFATIFFAVSIWMIVALLRRLHRQRAGIGLWFTLAVLLACGIALGVWCGFYVEYPIGSYFRFWSFPVPTGFFHLEDGVWVDFPLPGFFMWLIAVADTITVTALATSPLWLVLWRYHKHDHVA
jgi:hypothetical protein